MKSYTCCRQVTCRSSGDVKHLRIHGKGGKIRYLPLQLVAAAEHIYVYLVRNGDRARSPGPLLRSLLGKEVRYLLIYSSSRRTQPVLEKAHLAKARSPVWQD
ncbi:hypothetical protein ALQ26_200119 [Pseudomonas amygdali pv. lachrymans]|nr:hypothetical protein ALQ26_200119 [Pseudomonas amygdali pv. lachrymans]